MSSETVLLPEHLPAQVKAKGGKSTSFPEKSSLPTDYREAKSFFERTYLQEILFRFEGKINLTAKRTGLSKVTLIDKIRRYEIDVPAIKYQSHINKNSLAEAV